MTPALRATQVERGLRLEYVTISYNTIEAFAAIITGFFAGSIALVGFGLDSVIEVTSGVTLIWRLAADRGANREASERMALRIVGLCFMALAAYIAFESLESLLSRKAPEKSLVGIALAIGSIIVMPILARAKRHVAANINSASLEADAKQTELCAYLSVILLIGLLLNATLGWWWADPLAGLVMTPIIVKEGISALRGKPCGCSEAC